jgi:hypothetical protein
MTTMDYIRKVLQNHGRGVVTDEELGPALFPALSQENLGEFLVMVSPAVLQVLTRDALAAPRTDEDWRALRIVFSGATDRRDGESSRRPSADPKAQYRRGLEALRRHVETKLNDGRTG